MYSTLLFRRSCRLAAGLLLILPFCLAQGDTASGSGPIPPCGQNPIPPYSALDDPPAVKFWSEAAFGHDWRPPACTGWTPTGFSTLITTAARFRNPSGVEGLLRRIAATSELAGMRYWSTTHKHWQTLILSAHALTGPRSGRTRGDFAPDEIKEGAVLYFEQSDNLSGEAVYRMHIAAASPERLVFDVENVATVRYLFMTLFHPGEMQTIYYLDRETDDVWRFYSITRTGRNASRLVAGHEASSINRAVAFYRFLVGIRTDLEPPAAR